MNTDSLSVKFWGVRGSIACAGPNYVVYGGNTSCLEVTCGGHRMVFDAGTGLRSLGLDMLAKHSGPIDLFLTHTHFDHVVGLPFFVPMFLPQSEVRIWAGHLAPRLSLEEAIRGLMIEPLFPVPPDIFRAKIDYRDFRAGETLNPYPGVTLRTAPLNHPNGATGYRVDYGGKSICYITDTEHVEGQLDRTIISLVQNADIMIYDASYTDAEYPRFKGFGHSTWEEGVRLAKAAKVKTFVAFHHDPSHDDKVMAGIEKDLIKELPGAVVAKEGLVLTP